MSNDRASSSHATPLSAASAFVVHLSAAATEAPESIQGRVEHVLSGRSARFASSAEMVGFMQQTLRQDTEQDVGS